MRLSVSSSRSVSILGRYICPAPRPPRDDADPALLIAVAGCVIHMAEKERDER